MNRTEFLTELKTRLRHLPYDEIKSALDFYEEYFEEAGAENELQVLAELGTPANVAGRIISEFAMKNRADGKKQSPKGMSTIWIIVLGIFASPIALPMALVFVILVFSLLLVMASLLLSLGAVGAALLVSGLGSLVVGAAAMVIDFATGLFFAGVGLLAIGLGGIVVWLTIFLCKISIKGIVRLMAKFLNRRSTKNEK